jgi:hypothetical protein
LSCSPSSPSPSPPLRRPRVRRAIDALTGFALVALGMRLAGAERSA